MVAHQRRRQVVKAIAEAPDTALHPFHVHAHTFENRFLMIANFERFAAMMEVELVMLFAGSVHDDSVRLRESAHCIADSRGERKGAERILFERLADAGVSGSEQHDL